jgi:hypothetical protein
VNQRHVRSARDSWRTTREAVVGALVAAIDAVQARRRPAEAATG